MITKEWVKEHYVKHFKNKNPTKGGHITESLRRLQKFLKDNPDVTLEEIEHATLGYLRRTDAKFIRLPHYFVFKGKGYDKISDLEDWIERYREWKEEQEGRNDITNTLQ